MNSEIDSILTKVRRLSDEISQLGGGARKEALELEREQLRARARLIADSSRLRASLEAELADVEQQLAIIEEAEIKPALNERFRFITDPAAYRRRINESIAANQSSHREELERRRQELQEALHTQDMTEPD